MTVILTVEDEFLISEYLGSVLAEVGHEVIATAHAAQAIAVLESRDDIRIIITDINMPGSMDGLKLAAQYGGDGRRSKSSLLLGKKGPTRS